MPNMQQPAPAPKKISPLVWILGGIAVFILLLGGAAIIGTYFVVQKAKQAGIDADLMEKNPGLAVAKMMVAMNPEIELVSVDDRRGVITIKEKRTGKTMTVNFEDAKQGRISFTGENNEKVTVETDSEAGTAQVKSATGTLQIGGDVKLHSWVPVYPGADTRGTFSSQASDADSVSVHFTTKDSIDKVVKFYEASLKSNGLKVTSNIVQQDGNAAGGMITAEDEARKRNVMVTLGTSDEGTAVNLAITEKK